MNARWQNELSLLDVAGGATRTLVRHVLLWGPAFRRIAADRHSRSEVDGMACGWWTRARPRRVAANAGWASLSAVDTRRPVILYHTWSAPRRIWRVPYPHR